MNDKVVIMLSCYKRIKNRNKKAYNLVCTTKVSKSCDQFLRNARAQFKKCNFEKNELNSHTR